MSEKQIQSSSKGLKILFITVLILIVGVIVSIIAYRFWTPHQKKTSVATPSVKVSQPKATPLPSISPKPDKVMKPGIVSTTSVAIKPTITAKPSVAVKPSTPQPSVIPQPTPKVIDFDKLAKDKVLQADMDKRKQAYGVQKGIDMVVKPDETIKVGDIIVPMREIEEQIRLSRREIVESDIPTQNAGQNDNTTLEDKKHLTDPSNQPERKKESSESKMEEYGIYIVRPGDNIWNIHFRFLNGYFEKRGVSVSPLADEPIRSGVSSGVGKLLKFSENMVYLYNLEKRKLDVNLNTLTPHKRIVIYNMNRVFELLDQIDYQNVNRISFDGEALWVVQSE
ncbi:hypothetical protein QUF90_03990 [Desulfococcaceae bacterium HSG9]|nr:hypothetical protein [Desulfococcaceae bacterium HSG9]